MIRLGPAGSPLKSTLQGLSYIKSLGLDAMEVEFTYGVRMSNELAQKIGALAQSLGIQLSVHAPYYINLASENPEKVQASKKRIIESCERAHYLKACCVVFHPGFYGKHSEQECYSIIKSQIKDLKKTISGKSWKVQLAPETTGKKSQFGTLDELLRLMRETGSGICIDFSHIYARQGSISIKSIFDQISHLDNIHAHFSGIEFSEKGEKRHLDLKESEFLPLAEEIIMRRKNITIISESPSTWKDSLKMKKIIQKLQNEKNTP